MACLGSTVHLLTSCLCDPTLCLLYRTLGNVIKDKEKFEGLTLLTDGGVCFTSNLPMALSPASMCLAQILPCQIQVDHSSFSSASIFWVHLQPQPLSLTNSLQWIPLTISLAQTPTTSKQTGSAWSFPFSLFPFPACFLAPCLFMLVRLLCSKPHWLPGWWLVD